MTTSPFTKEEKHFSTTDNNVTVTRLKPRQFTAEDLQILKQRSATPRSVSEDEQVIIKIDLKEFDSYLSIVQTYNPKLIQGKRNQKLMTAIQSGDWASFNTALQLGANVNCCGQNKLYQKITPLHLAAIYGEEKMAQELINYGANLNALMIDPKVDILDNISQFEISHIITRGNKVLTTGYTPIEAAEKAGQAKVAALIKEAKRKQTVKRTGVLSFVALSTAAAITAVVKRNSIKKGAVALVNTLLGNQRNS